MTGDSAVTNVDGSADWGGRNAASVTRAHTTGYRVPKAAGNQRRRLH
jgi:hypothetical protein